MTAEEGKPDSSQAYGSRAWETPADTRGMQALVSRCWRADWPAQHLHPGDLDWWTVHALGRTPGLDGRVRLWFAGEPDATELVGFAWFGPPNDSDLVVAPGHRSTTTLGPMIDWVEARVAAFAATPPAENEAKPLAARIWTVASEHETTSALGRLGFAVGPEPGINHYSGTLAALDLGSPAALPGGYTLRTIASDTDIAARVVAGHAAFPGSTMTADKYRFCRTTPLYRPALDTIVVTPDGAVAAFALGWLDAGTLALELEPVGVHPDHQRRGLGRAVCQATLRAAAAMGAQQAVIAADVANPAANGLYGSLGLAITARIVLFSRVTPGT